MLKIITYNLYVFVTSDAVSATGQPKTPQECINKLRTYPSEVKGRVSNKSINIMGWEIP